MHRFNVFKAFSGSSRGSSGDPHRTYVNYANEEAEYRPSTYGQSRRQVLTKRLRENGQRQQRGQVPAVFTPIPSRRATVEDYNDSDATLSIDEEGPAFDSITGRPPSPIPAVHREEQPSRLREVFSDSGSGFDSETQSDDDSVMGDGTLTHSPRHLPESEALQHPPGQPIIPIDMSVGTEDHMGGDTEGVGGYYPEDTSSWQNGSGSLPSRGRSPQVVGIPDFRAPSHDIMQVGASATDRNTALTHFRKAQAYSDEYYEDPRGISHQSRTDDTYYIIPNGTNVIFQDEDGNEITRVGDFGSGRSHRRTRRPAPLIIQDEYGRELYRTGEFDGSSHSSRSSDPSYYRLQSNTMPIDPYDRGSYRHRRNQFSHGYHHPPPVTYVDHRGREIYPNMGVPRNPSSDRSYSSYASSSPNYILIDHHGRQIPLSTSGSTSNKSGRSYR